LPLFNLSIAASVVVVKTSVGTPEVTFWRATGTSNTASCRTVQSLRFLIFFFFLFLFSSQTSGGNEGWWISDKVRIWVRQVLVLVRQSFLSRPRPRPPLLHLRLTADFPLMRDIPQ
ncbi:hypothetical protein F5141DRAFT_1097370, partial [Pisolithus sp. B1]